MSDASTSTLDEIGTGDHLLDGLDSGDRLLRKGEPQRDSAEQLAVDIDWTSAHSLHHARFGERAAAQLREDDALLWREVLEDTEDLDLEFLDTVAFENGPANATQARADIFEREELLSDSGSSGDQQEDRDSKNVHHCLALWLRELLGD